ncbi:attacin-C [Drosophila santomea]|uniref:attacin-C n=1 Tax=Drosophila santomea TaxID=129105 RepID=UPI0019549C19|nr:attacin-C [Drosophila santomea]
MSKIVLLIVVIIGVLGCLAVALPQRVYTQPLIYYPPPPTPPRIYRARRQVLGGSLTSNPAGGADARLDLSKAIGTPDHHVIGQVIAASNTQTKPVSTPVTSGATLGYNNHGHGLELTKTHTPGVRDSFQQTATANLFNNGVHNLDAKAFASQNQLANGFKFDRNGAGLDYSHIKGHGATLTHANIPGLGKQLELGGRANLWQSQDRNTRLDLGSTASKWTSGPFKGQTDLGANLGLSHYFG